MAARLSENNISVDLTEAAKDLMIKEAYDPVYGARPLKRYISNNIETILARKIIGGQIKPGDRVKIDSQDDQIVIS